jgi:hypothetical protein
MSGPRLKSPPYTADALKFGLSAYMGILIWGPVPTWRGNALKFPFLLFSGLVSGALTRTFVEAVVPAAGPGTVTTMRILRRRPSPALAVALLALFVALGGPAEAKRLIDGKLLRKGSVTSRAIKNGSVARADLSRTAVRSLTATPVDSVRSAQIVNGQVLAPDLGGGAVTAAALAPASVTASKLAADSIGGGSVANGSLQTLDIGSFAGAISVPNFNFTDTEPCQAAEAQATPTGGQPNIADDVVLVSPPSGWPDTVVVTGKPAPGNRVRVVACWTDLDVTGLSIPTPTIFRYVTFDNP